MKPVGAVFLDRDGVLNEALIVGGKPFPPRSLAQLRVEPSARAGCRELKRAGYKLICVTNQPDISRGRLDRNDLSAINEAVAAELDLDEVVVCPHSDEDTCDCRKPKPGMIVAAAARHGVELPSSYMIGDRWRDVEAGRAAGCFTIFLDRGYAERRPETMDFVCADLGGASRHILGRRGRGLDERGRA